MPKTSWKEKLTMLFAENPKKPPNETIFVLAKIQTFLTKYNFCVY